MISAKARLIIPSVLFAAWLTWLAVLGLTKANPVVVAPAQIMAATHLIIVEVKIDAETGKPDVKQRVIEQVGQGKSELKSDVQIANLREARIAGHTQQGFQAGVKYLLPITQLGDEIFELTPPPKAPGNERLNRGRPWAYVWTPEVEKQLARLVK